MGLHGIINYRSAVQHARHGGDPDLQELPPMADTRQSGGGHPSSGLGLRARRHRAPGDREYYIDRHWGVTVHPWPTSSFVLFSVMFTRLFCDVRQRPINSNPGY